MSLLFTQFLNDTKINQKQFIKKSNNNLRFLSFNVHMWKNINNKIKYQEMIELIKESNADIVGLQEAMLHDKMISKSYKNDFEKIGYKYQFVANEKHGINILLSKIEIENIKILKLKQDPVKKLNRYAIFGTINLNQKINIVVTHLDVYDETEETRLNQIKFIVESVEKMNFSNKTIIMGDFNCLRSKDYTENDWKRIRTHDLKRNVTSMTLVTDYLEQQKYQTFNLDMSVWSMRRVDYIYTKNITNFINFSSYPSDLSDHYPIYVDLQI